jgi:adenosine tuberculosinyltransferase
MDFESFCALTYSEVAALVQSTGPCVCAFPVNGTRRWFLLEGNAGTEDFSTAYLRTVITQHIRLYQSLFDHGIDTLLLPILGDDLMERGPEYAAMAVEGMRKLTAGAQFLEFYQTHQIRVRFYGDYRKRLEHTPYASVLPQLDQVAEQTASYGPRRIFFGLFANDATETAAQLAVDFYRQEGRPPLRREMVSLYYGEDVDPVRFFIGFDKCSIYDMPLVATGSEDLYFTLAPSLYLTARCLRAILFDHLFVRRAKEPEYASLTPAALDRMRAYYGANREKVMGIGTLVDGIWYPQPSAEWPASFSPLAGRDR